MSDISLAIQHITNYPHLSFNDFLGDMQAVGCTISEASLKMLYDKHVLADEIEEPEESVREFYIKPSNQESQVLRIPTEGWPKPSTPLIKTPENYPTKDNITEAAKDVTDKYLAYQQAASRLSPSHPKALSFDLTKCNKPIAITGLGDVHAGSPKVAYGLLEKDLNTIADTPGMYGVLLGDIIQNFIIPNLAHAGRGDMDPSLQEKVVLGYLKIAEEFLIYSVGGNHDGWTKKMSGIDILEILSKKLNIQYNGNEGIGTLFINYKDLIYKAVFKHKGMGMSKVNPVYPTKKIYDQLVSFDVCYTAHSHLFGMEVFQRHGLERYAAVCGSYKIEDSFGAMIGCPDAFPYMPTYIYLPDHRELIGFHNVQTASRVLTALRADYE